ncbi:MAG: excinuclease ABC subunit UvrB [Candidatus Nanoarchaeia archaeon]|nr:excinuclease ABC subunit UvrB [Candidatus Nanoarchaeia archaeon]
MNDYSFKLESNYKPSGDQPKAIEKLIEGIKKGFDKQTLLGVTGSGKTFTIANVINKYQKPTLVLAHNKTLAFQLYNELKEFFPHNKVEFFISYYDYYQPESYIPSTDTYIEKDSSINEEIERMRLSATISLMSRKDVIIVASVSAIYNVGDPQRFDNISKKISINQSMSRRELMQILVDMLYERNEIELLPGKFRVRGNIIDLVPGHQKNIIRIQIDKDKIVKIDELSNMDLEKISDYENYHIFPAKQFVAEKENIEKVTNEIKKELNEYLPIIEEKNPLFAYRLKQKVSYDIDMIKEMGFCKGIENYSSYFDNRKKGDKPYCLIDYFPKDFLFVIDESHQSLPQVRGMYNGDRSRKETLVEYGFRLPSALENRPLKFDEFEKYLTNAIFVSATPGPYEIENSKQIVEQIIRPTGLLDPIIQLKPAENQIKDVLKEIEINTKKGFRTLITTLTKKLAEELTDYLAKNDVKVRYLHSEIDSIQRSEIIRQLRLKKFDVIVGINLLREGLDIPEVGLVAILDADKEGFLRDQRSLIQTIGRAARNSESKVILYADKITDSIKGAIQETKRRREIQEEYNRVNNITPITISKSIQKEITTLKDSKNIPKGQLESYLIELESDMKQAAEELNFEKAIEIRNQIKKLQKELTYK